MFLFSFYFFILNGTTCNFYIAALVFFAPRFAFFRLILVFIMQTALRALIKFFVAFIIIIV
ncbi:MAG TPA: hypothetical protein DCZ84_02355 [Candidatus Vogelbacteria bacterium]|uniref:Uncharacterized protein n=1 Tax=Candidatus Vogelbacteria bacterium RIFOXYD1_FULL_51_18 TaxID=1802440 RepID=A0A1G2QK83_9BACT|nr:MAG: hypothetical protein A2569_02770 [Candidatus Vogelbacteria bacterium RIFOXYD1_FULL_51_18]HBB65453.1 hypothetical protein [Candidatus Vogelbacteria bacterium]HCQ91935.1 hypothetical protein [Candidatus Vogelbacteria bacterium]